MKLHKAVSAAVLAFLLSAGVAAAQTTYPDSGSTVPSDSTTGNGTTITDSPATAPQVPNTGTDSSDTGSGSGSTGSDMSTPGVPNTGSTVTSGSGTTTPGVPNTGVGDGAASTMLLLMSSALAAILGGAYLYRRVRV